MIRVGICFSRNLEGDTPLAHIGTKEPVYKRLLVLMKNEGWDVFVLTRKTYKGGGFFDGGWRYENGKFSLANDRLKIDLVFDRTGGVSFPLEDDDLKVVNRRDFKVLCWDKWAGYKMIGEYMPQTLLLESEDKIKEVAKKINSDWVVLKPFNGLKGLGIYIGNKQDAVSFKFPENFKKYIAQEYVDTSNGIDGLTGGKHDLRVAVVNGQVVWCHIRVPAPGTFLANAAQGGNLTEVDYEKVPESVKKIVKIISKKFYDEYDNPMFSLDFGINEKGIPLIFEINDQIGFPKWEMKNRDVFLNALVANFSSKI